MKEKIDTLLKENTWASVKLNDLPKDLRHTLVCLGKVEDMIDKEIVIKILNNEVGK